MLINEVKFTVYSLYIAYMDLDYISTMYGLSERERERELFNILSVKSQSIYTVLN